MLDRILASVFDEEHQFQNLWELKLIRFNIDLEEDSKSYEKQIGMSNNVEDVKGNPGLKGCLQLSNLRIVWHATVDTELNISIGFDTLISVKILSFPLQNAGLIKHVLTLKTISPKQAKYEFKFSGVGDKEQQLFRMIQCVCKQAIQTKYLRCIDTNVKAMQEDYEPIQREEVKSRYNNCDLQENGISRSVAIVLTNARIVILNSKQNKANYGIPWIMIESYEINKTVDINNMLLKIRGLLKDTEILLSCAKLADQIKMFKQIESFSEIYNKNPVLGIDWTSVEGNSVSKKSIITSNREEIQQIEMTKVNMGRRRNAYGQSKLGDLSRTEFNKELGILMEQLPNGLERIDLWSIIKEK